MEENLLTYITRRWRGAPGNSQTDRLDELQGSFKWPESILIVHAGDSFAELGWRAERLAEAVKARTSATVFGLGSERGWAGSLRRTINLIDQIRSHQLVHLLVGSYGQLVKQGMLMVVLSLFYGKPVVMELSGGWVSQVKNWQKIALRGWMGRSAALVVPYGEKGRFKFGQGLRIDESIPLINVEGCLVLKSMRLQPSILADCRSCAPEKVNELIEGFELTKLKYPRTEMTLLFPTGNESISDRPGLTIVDKATSSEIDSLIVKAELFVSAHTAPILNRALLTAAAGGRIIMTGELSRLTQCLKERYRFDPISFSNRSDFASQIFRLIEEPDLTSANSRRSVVLAEQFAVDNLAPEIMAAYVRYFAEA